MICKRHAILQIDDILPDLHNFCYLLLLKSNYMSAVVASQPLLLIKESTNAKDYSMA